MTEFLSLASGYGNRTQDFVLDQGYLFRQHDQPLDPNEKKLRKEC